MSRLIDADALVAQMLPDNTFLINSENYPTTNGVVAWMHAPDPYRKETK